MHLKNLPGELPIRCHRAGTQRQRPIKTHRLRRRPDHLGLSRPRSGFTGAASASLTRRLTNPSDLRNPRAGLLGLGRSVVSGELRATSASAPFRFIPWATTAKPSRAKAKPTRKPAEWFGRRCSGPKQQTRHGRSSMESPGWSRKAEEQPLGNASPPPPPPTTFPVELPPEDCAEQGKVGIPADKNEEALLKM